MIGNRATRSAGRRTRGRPAWATTRIARRGVAAVATATSVLLVGGLLVAPPAGARSASPLVRFRAPAANAHLTRPLVPVVLVLGPEADQRSLRVRLDLTHDVTSRLHRYGDIAYGTLNQADGLQSGPNLLEATVTGRDGRSGQDSVLFTVRSGGLGSGTPDLPLPTFALASRVATANSPAASHAYAVTVGSVTHTAPQPSGWACPEGVWVLALSRDGLNEASSADYSLCSPADMTKLTAAVKDLPDTSSSAGPPMVIVNSLNNGSAPQLMTPPGLGTAMAEVGAVAREFDQIDLRTTAFSIVGIRGIPAGQAHQVSDSLAAENVTGGAPTPASVNGTLVHDNYGNFALVMRDDVRYDVSAAGVVTLNGVAYPIPAAVHPGYGGGFHVVVFDRRTLGPISNTLYETNSDDAIAEQARLNTALAGLTEGDLVFVAAVGEPLPPFPTVVPPGCPHPTNTEFLATCTYQQTGNEQLFTVPAQLTQLQVTAVGAVSGHARSGGASGHGDVVTAHLPVGAAGSAAPLHFGQRLYVEVGGNGGTGDLSNPVPGGFNGGGGGGESDVLGGYSGAGGGGASDVRTCSMADAGCTLTSRVLVAGGGGGGGGDGSTFGGYPGGNGGPAGHAGATAPKGATGGGSGTATGGGAGGTGSHGPADAGSLGAGGHGGYGPGGGAGGGGGGGYYGGGGGGGDKNGGGGGGGGGSDLVPAGGSAAPDTSGHATVTISYPLPGPTLGQGLRRLGATPDIIESLVAHPRYALVGAISPPPDYGLGRPNFPEANELIQPGATGELQGVLHRGTRGMWYGPAAWNAPVIKVVNGVTQPPTLINLSMYDVLSPRVSLPWPVPVPAGTPGHDGQQAAYSFISQSDNTCGCPSLRAEYDVADNTIALWRQGLAALPVQSGPGFSEADFRAVQNELETELTDVYAVDGLRGEMHTLLSDQNQMLAPKLEAAYRDVRASIPVDSSEKVLSVIAPLLEAVASLAEPLGHFGSALGVVSALAFNAESASADPNGALYEALDTTVGELANQAVLGFGAALENLTQTFGEIYSDYGKLSTVANGMLNDSADWDIHDEAAAATAMSDAGEVGYYRALIPVVYLEREGTAAFTPDPAKWYPSNEKNPYFPDDQLGISAYSFSVAPPPNYTPRYPETDIQNPVYDMEVVGQKISYGRIGDPFPASLMKDLTDLAVYPAYLFERWPLQRSTCLGTRDPETWDGCYP